MNEDRQHNTLVYCYVHVDMDKWALLVQIIISTCNCDYIEIHTQNEDYGIITNQNADSKLRHSNCHL